jgi:general secretion pathway protein A
MLIKHFKLGIQPFGVTPDTRFLYPSRTHREALASLIYGIRSGRGFTALIAPPGMGKTTLLFQLLKILGGNAKTAFLFQTLCGTEEFLRSLLGDLGIEHGVDDVTQMHGKLNAYLAEESKKGHEVVVVIDEAQNLDDRVLELVRMLSNFETSGKKLMHLILSGQPQLAEKLASERFTQLRQRISIVARLNPFSANETREYIEHRLHVAGAPCEKAVFSNQAYAVIAEHSLGIPRNINNLCFNAMSLACALKRPQVDALMVREVINDLDLTTIGASNKPEIRPRPWSTLFGPSTSPAVSWKHGVVPVFGFLSALAALFQPWRPWTDRAMAKHTTDVVQQKTTDDSKSPQNLATTLPSPLARSLDSPPGAEVGEKDGRSSFVLDVHPPSGELWHSRVSSTRTLSRNSQPLEKPSDDSEKSSVPFELTPQREKP